MTSRECTGLLKNTTEHYISTSQLLRIEVSGVLEQFELVVVLHHVDWWEEKAPLSTLQILLVSISFPLCVHDSQVHNCRSRHLFMH